MYQELTTGGRVGFFLDDRESEPTYADARAVMERMSTSRQKNRAVFWDLKSRTISRKLDEILTITESDVEELKLEVGVLKRDQFTEQQQQPMARQTAERQKMAIKIE